MTQPQKSAYDCVQDKSGFVSCLSKLRQAVSLASKQTDFQYFKRLNEDTKLALNVAVSELKLAKATKSDDIKWSTWDPDHSADVVSAHIQLVSKNLARALKS